MCTKSQGGKQRNLILKILKFIFLDLAVAKSLQSTRMVSDDDADDDVLTTTGYTC